MKKDLLTTQDVYNSLLSGANNIITNAQELNDINVFPVPDGDTGSNLTHTMESVIHSSSIEKDLKSTMDTVARSALYGARGNSGTIFAQYLHGLSEACRPTNHLSASDLAKMSRKAYESVYTSLNSPVEGTIITVMDDFATALEDNKSQGLSQALSSGYHAICHTLENTKDMLPVLKKANVVDAGANAFVLFVEGILHYFNGNITQIPKKRLMKISPDFESHSPDLQTGRYCCEFSITDLTLDKASIKEYIEPIGDDIVFAGNNDYLHIHVHTNFPDKVASVLYNTSKVIHQKIDDMQLQIAVLKDTRNICIVTDSIADLPKLTDLSTPIPVIPVNITINNQEFLDRLTIHNHSIHEALSLNLPMSSSSPTRENIKRTLTLLDKHYDHIVVITVSNAMSGTFQQLSSIANKWKGKAKIHVIDSRRNSAAQGLIVMKSVSYSMNTNNVEDLLMYIDALITRTNIYVTLDHLTGMIKSGRIPVKLGRIMERIGIKPIVSIDDHGKGILIKSGLKRHQTEAKIIKYLKRIHAEQEIVNYCIVYSSYDQSVDEFSKKIEAILHRKPAYTTSISSIVAMTTGPDAIAIGFTTRRRKL